MSLLPPEVHTALTQLLAGLSSSENDVRTRAEEQLNTEWVAARPNILLMGLVEQMLQSPDASVRHRFLLGANFAHVVGANACRRGHLQLSCSVECQRRLENSPTRANRPSCL